jgi:hypothetical protein
MNSDSGSSAYLSAMSNTTSLQTALDYVESLPPDDQDLLIELIQKRRIEQRRNAIAQNAVEALSALKAGTAKRGTLADLRADLLSDAE